MSLPQQNPSDYITAAIWNAVIDAVNAVANVPAGVFFPYGGTTAPSGYLLCNGAAVSRTTYADLFAAIGTAYGVGDGSTTFNVPDVRGRFVLGKAAAGTGSTLGESGGALDHTHTGPSHTHAGPSHTHAAGTLAGPSHTHTGPSHSHGIATHTHGVNIASGQPDNATTSYNDAIQSYVETSTGAGQVAHAYHTHTLAHFHGVIGDTAAGGTAATQNGGADATTAGGTGAVTGSTAASGTGATGAGGTGATGANNPAYLVANYIIKY